MATRKIRQVLQSKPTREGAGVHLRRVFGFSEVPRFDPFLLLDDFRNDDPDLFLAGFPWHPHRGIETITYMIGGEVEHGDSMGNTGVISAGDVQWMTAGSGIIHQEMPRGDEAGRMLGFQLWANLPASHKMMPPRYQEVKRADIPERVLAGGARVRIIAGEIDGTRGPVRDIVIEPEYLDVTLPKGASFTHPARPGHTVFAYVIAGEGSFGELEVASPPDSAGGAVPRIPTVGNRELVLFADGDAIVVNAGRAGGAGESDLRFLLVAGKPLGEPVAWQGPIVMNTREELRTAFEEYQSGDFIKQERP